MRTLGQAVPAIHRRAELGEGPRWDAEHERLLWVDIEGRRLYVGERAIELGAMVGAAAPWRRHHALVALAGALVRADLRDGRVEQLVDLPHRRAGMRANDGACDAAGRFWIGTMALDLEPGAGALYRYDPDGTLHEMLAGATLSNGLGWDAAERRMFYIDSPTQRVDVLDFEPAGGDVGNRRPFAEIPEADGTPDGLAVDDEDHVWVALYGGGEVRRFDPGGVPVARVVVPAANVTACCFAGPRMYITTAAGPGTDAGAVFAIDLPVSGPPARPFRG